MQRERQSWVEQRPREAPSCDGNRGKRHERENQVKMSTVAQDPPEYTHAFVLKMERKIDQSITIGSIFTHQQSPYVTEQQDSRKQL